MTELRPDASLLKAYAEKGDEYFEWLRSDVLAYVPSTARRVLSTGCGAGVTEGELVKRGVNVVGIELNPVAAQRARSRGLTMVDGDATQIARGISAHSFDCMIYADVLEHIADPVAVLRSHVSMLEPHGRVIISVPNFRHYEVLLELFVRGHVRYEDSGILDRTHLRMTTRRMAEQWCVEVGLRPVGYRYNMSRRREILISACSLGLLREFVARQVIVVAEKN